MTLKRFELKGENTAFWWTKTQSSADGPDYRLSFTKFGHYLVECITYHAEVYVWISGNCLDMSGPVQKGLSRKATARVRLS
jgi:hypothetical protein